MKKVLVVLFISLGLFTCKEKEIMKTDHFKTLVKNELDFESLSESTGRRTAFMTYLHDSSLVLGPTPINGKQLYKDVPDTPGELLWHPEYAYISHAGDLGFTTGPWKYSIDKGKTYTIFGHYISIWQNDSSDWKILFDGGISYRDKYDWPDTTEWFTVPTETIQNEGNQSEDSKEVIREFFTSRETSGDLKTFDFYEDKDLKIYKSPKIPFAYRNSDKTMPSKEKVTGFKNILTRTSASNDFFYSLDEVVKKDRTENKAKKYTSLTIWIKRVEGWKLLICLESFVE
jgi:ketosteroid isomerase-like protein